MNLSSATLQAIDETTIKAFALASQALMVGAKCQKINQLTAYDFLLSFWMPTSQHGSLLLAEHQHLFISLRKESPFICWLNNADAQQLQAIHGKGRTTPLGAVLKKYVLGAKLEGFSTTAGEPILQLNFTTTTDLGFRMPITLTLELMGRFTNLILIETATQKITGLFNVVTETMSRLRQLRVGGLYALPPTPTHKPLLETLLHLSSAQQESFRETLLKATTPTQWVATVQATFWGCSKPLLKAIAARSGCVEDFLNQLVTWLRCPLAEKQFVVIQQGNNQPRFMALPIEWLEKTPSFSDEKVLQRYASATKLLKAVYFTSIQQHRFVQVYKQFAKPLRQALEQLQEQLTTYQNIASIQAQANQYQTQADWLITLLSMQALEGTHPKSAKISLENIFDPDGETPILKFEALQPAKTWKQNSHWLYKQVQKLNGRVSYFASQVAQLKTKQHHLQTLQVHLESVETLADFDYLRLDWQQAGLLPSLQHQAKVTQGKKKQKIQKIAKKPEKPAGILTLIAPNTTLEVWVGKSSQANGYLAGKALRAEDWWFHVGEGIAGSHVVVRSTGTPYAGKPLPSQAIEFVAGLAAYYSGAKESAKVPVMYTLGKFVRPIPHSYPGHVSHCQETSLIIAPAKAEILAVEV